MAWVRASSPVATVTLRGVGDDGKRRGFRAGAGCRRNRCHRRHRRRHRFSFESGDACAGFGVHDDGLGRIQDAAAAKANGEIAAFPAIHRRPSLNHGVGRLASNAGKKRMRDAALFQQRNQRCHMALMNH